MPLRNRSAEAVGTADYLEFHALHRPNAPALIDGRRRIVYAEFHRDLAKFTTALARFELPVGRSLAVCCVDFYVHWLLLLAAENLGLVTGSCVAAEGGALAPLLDHVDLILTDQHLPGANGPRVHTLSAQWLGEVFALDGDDAGVAARRVDLGLESPQRIARSSGTTGTSKMMLVNRRFHEVIYRHYTLLIAPRSESVYLITHAFSAATVYTRATLFLRLGATCLANIGWDQISKYGCTHMWLQPPFLEQFLRSLPNGFVKPRTLSIGVGGAPLPAALRESALRDVASEITIQYAANEVGIIGAVSSEGITTVLPGVEVEIVDDGDRPVPAGGIGTVKVRSPGIVDGYVGNPEATAKFFRGGWFLTGDAGTLESPRRLRIIGRRDEVLNMGGLKYAPEDVEDTIRKVAGVADVGVTYIENTETIQEPCVAFVCAPGAGAEDVANRIKRALPFPAMRTWTRAIDRIPRTDNGKIQRHLLKALFLGR